MRGLPVALPCVVLFFPSLAMAWTDAQDDRFAQPPPGWTGEQDPAGSKAFSELFEHPNRGNEAFRLTSDRLNLSVNLMAQVQTAFYVQDEALVDNDDPATTEGFRLRRARLGFHAMYCDQLGVNLVVDMRDPDGGGYAIAGANLVYRPFEWLNVALGTAPLPFSRGAMESSSKLQMIERPLSVTRLVPASQLGGVVMGAVAGGRFEYAAGVFNGAPGRFTKGDVGRGLLYVGRVQTAPLGRMPQGESDYEQSPLRFAVGGDVFFDNDSDIQALAVSGDVGLKWRGLSVRGEAIWDRRKPSAAPILPPTLPATTQRLGFYGQAGYFAVPRLLEIAARYEWFDDQRDLSDAGDVWLLTGGANVYLFDGILKAQLNYVHRHERKVRQLANDVLFAQFQANF